MADIKRREVLIGGGAIGLAAVASSLPDLAAQASPVQREVPASPLLSVQHGPEAVIIVEDFSLPVATRFFPERRARHDGVPVEDVALAEQLVVNMAKWVVHLRTHDLADQVREDGRAIQERSGWMAGNTLLAPPALVALLASGKEWSDRSVCNIGGREGRWEPAGCLWEHIGIYSGEHLPDDEMILFYRDRAYDAPGTLLVENGAMSLITQRPRFFAGCSPSFASRDGWWTMDRDDGQPEIVMRGGVRSRMTRIKVVDNRA